MRYKPFLLVALCMSQQADAWWQKPTCFLRTLLHDLVDINTQFISWDTVKVGLFLVPCYGAGRAADKRVHHNFYFPERHENNSCFYDGAHRFMDQVVVAGLLSLPVGLYLFGDDDRSMIGRVCAMGIISVWGAKNVFKQWEHDGCLRPRNGNFSRHETYYGGCPSGHVAFATCLTTALTVEYGWGWGFPLSVLSGGLIVSSIDGNRHFVSQIIAGAGLGIAYGIAVHKSICNHQNNPWAWEVGTDDQGGPALNVSYAF
jgi:membrane-associated phospholipid phosphatase